jgi:phage terminase small subunit
MPRTVRKDNHLKPGKPEKPVTLSAAASAAWDRLCGQLERSQIELTVGHSRLLMLAATLEADMSRAWDAVKTEGEYLENRKTGVHYQHPASKRLDALRRDYIKVLSTLGLRAQAAPPHAYEGPTMEDILDGPPKSPEELLAEDRRRAEREDRQRAEVEALRRGIVPTRNL